MIRHDPNALRASFEGYRSIDHLIVQIERRKTQRLAMPVMAFAGDLACGRRVEEELQVVADNLVSLIIPDCGHFVPEEAPKILVLLEPLLRFLEPYHKTAVSN
ncbi:hypothetical protein F5884DRAFT_769803 [Xylogone sp. PMI_703]|nr:hypothetical protein F5884DRAFT_769803 [Xylogone sp. PMI_703]